MQLNAILVTTGGDWLSAQTGQTEWKYESPVSVAKLLDHNSKLTQGPQGTKVLLWQAETDLSARAVALRIGRQSPDFPIAIAAPLVLEFLTVLIVQ